MHSKITNSDIANLESGEQHSGEKLPFKIMGADRHNTEFNLATEFVNNTNKSIFLTGKAGTGKTTFLKYIKNTTQKNCVIVAPTGVAAINAGGTTIHSFFQLPFGPFIPGSSGLFGLQPGFSNKHSIFRNIHLSKDKIELLQELDLLIIDEVSMVRCDIIDAIDTVLRYYRKQPNNPFGGVQVLFIGDLFQLPPVIPGAEWELLKQYYDSPYFFSSLVTREFPLLYLELRKIYRQNDQSFINILNRVRNNEVEWEDLETLHNCYDPNFKSAGDANYIMLSTHNKKVEAINAVELQNLSNELYKFEGTLTGEFSEKTLPTDLVLNLKEGAQVMFIKNDTEMARRYYNGKLASIKKIGSEEIIVEFTDTGREMVLEKATWENISYTLNKETGEIDEKVEGTFTQYPIKLAWAITVHKSQGLTFERAIVDLGASFAPGQVYVALSRCTSLSGLVLHSRIPRHCIKTDPVIIEFAENELTDGTLEEILQDEKQLSRRNGLLSAFEFDKCAILFNQHLESSKSKKNDAAAAGIKLAEKLFIEATRLQQVALNFHKELNKLFEEYKQNKQSSLLENRMEAATTYFTTCIENALLKPLQQHRQLLTGKKRVRKYIKQLEELEKYCDKKMEILQNARAIFMGLN